MNETAQMKQTVDGGGVFVIGVECLLFGTPISNDHCHGVKLYTTPSKHD